MWLAANTPSPVWQVATTIGGALLALVSAVLVAWFSLRGTTRTTDAARESAFEARVDARLSQAEARLEEMTVERDRYRELYAQLRVGVRNAGLDPDELGGRPST